MAAGIQRLRALVYLHIEPKPMAVWVHNVFLGSWQGTTFPQIPPLVAHQGGA